MPGRTLPTIPSGDVSSRTTAASCYVTRGTKVYDVTSFLEDHPGGGDLILEHAGKDVSQIMDDELSHSHSDSAYEKLDEQYLIGFVATEPVLKTVMKSPQPSNIVPLPPNEIGMQELEENGCAEEFPPKIVYAATGMSCEADLSVPTDHDKDYQKHKFLDLNKPLLKQVWNGGFSREFYLEQVHRPRCYKRGESAPLFGNCLEYLTKTPWYIVPMIWLPCVAYGTFLAYRQLPLSQTVAYWLTGLALWTLVEYTLHRGLFHVDKYLPDNRVGITAHFLLHGIHHYMPMDRLRLVMPPTLFIVLATPFYRLAHFVFYWDWYVAIAVFCGGIFGYVCYDVTHYSLHHKKLPSYYQILRRYHMDHHYKDYENGFGVTSRFWDRVFVKILHPYRGLAYSPLLHDLSRDVSLDVEALLDSTANAASSDAKDSRSADRDSRHRGDRGDRRDRDRRRDGSRDRDRDRRRRDKSRDRARGYKDADGDEIMKSPRNERGSGPDSYRSRRRSRSRDSDRRHSRRHRDSVDPDDAFRASGGDYYRGNGRPRTRSRSPVDDRHYRPSGRERRDDDERVRDRSPRRDRNGGRKRTPSPKPVKAKSPTPQPTEDERDRRTVFVQQLAARLRTKELIAFFEKVGPVKEAQIVKDRVSGRSKGVGYVEFKQEESVPQAIQLTGQKLLGIPIIAQLTEAEKNRQARNPEASSSNPNQVPFHRLYVGNIHFSITESDLQNVFEPFGELEFVQLQKEEQGRSRGYGFVQFRDPNQAREALEKMNGFDLAGRPIRVGLGNDKFTPESTANLLQRFQGQEHQRNYQGSAFSGHGGRGSQAGGGGGAFDRAGGRDNEKGGGGASALDDTDVAGVNFNNYSRDALMRKLARTDEPAADTGANEQRKVARPKTENKPLPVTVNQASRCVKLENMFNPLEEEGESWVKELEDDVRAECNEKYGRVVHISVDPNTQGDIYLKFDRVQGGENAIKGLNGRFFGGRQISAQPVVDAVYSSLFSRTSAL